MNRAKFYMLSPSGNTTLLFKGLNYTEAERYQLAHQGLSELGGEQAGFVDIQQGILQMAGGEFCINATRCLALLMALDASNGNIKDNMQFNVKTSGFEHSLTVQIKPVGDEINVDLFVPLQSVPPIAELDLGMYLVQLPGINHVLIDEQYKAFDENNWQKDSANIREQYNLEQAIAVGCIWWSKLPADEQKKLCNLRMHPVVRVLKPFALHYENACGSGVLALGLWHYLNNEQSKFVMQQPGGNLTLDLQEDIQGLKGIIGGPVQLLLSGDFKFGKLK